MSFPKTSYGVGRTGDNIKAIREALERRGEWNVLTERQQERWIEVLGHNLHDCLGLRAVVRHAAGALVMPTAT